MNSPWWTVFKKEIRETLRDRRTLFVAFVLPLLLYPALLIGMTQIISVTQSNLKDKKLRGLEHPPMNTRLVSRKMTN